MSADEPSFGALLKQYRQAAGLTQEELAERARLSVRAISNLERGVNRIPRQETLDLLAQALRLPPRKHSMLAGSARPASALTATWEPQIQPSHHVPTPLTPLIGREAEVTRATSLLERKAVRLLTLIGPSGVGKTRLGLQVAEDVLDHFDDGAWFVALAPLRDASLVAAAIAQALELRAAAGQAPQELLKTALREQQRLLLLDNFEQVTEAAPLVAELLSACPRLKVLVTSRAALHIRGEHELPIEPLEQEAAVTLFLQRAQAIQPDLDCGPEETMQVAAAICQRLDRLPLALELAAARVKVLPLPILLERLKSRLPLLTGGALDLPERQRTMRDAIAWSYELLGSAEQRLFRRLAIFAGGCTLEAAEAICGEGQEGSSSAVLEELTVLVDQSLVRSERVAERLRLTMLEVIREFALEQLQVHDEAEALHQRHAAYYLRLAEATGRIGPAQDARDAQIIEERANARVALEWARAHNESELGLRLATACGRTWYIYGMGSEVLFWLETFLSLDTQAGVHAEPAVRIAALYGIGQMALARGDYKRAEMLAQEELTLAERAGDESGMGNALAHLGVVAETRGDLHSAARFLEEGIAHCRKAGDIGGTERALVSLGHVFRALGDYVHATQTFEEALQEARSVNLTWVVAIVLTSLGHLAREQGDYRRASARYRESLGLHRAFDTREYIAWCFEGMAVAACALDQPERGVQLCAAAERMREAEHMPRPSAEQHLYDQVVAAAQAALGDERFEQAWSAGRTLSLEGALSYALTEPPEC